MMIDNDCDVILAQIKSVKRHPLYLAKNEPDPYYQNKNKVVCADKEKIISLLNKLNATKEKFTEHPWHILLAENGAPLLWILFTEADSVKRFTECFYLGYQKIKKNASVKLPNLCPPRLGVTKNGFIALIPGIHHYDANILKDIETTLQNSWSHADSNKEGSMWTARLIPKSYENIDTKPIPIFLTSNQPPLITTFFYTPTIYQPPTHYAGIHFQETFLAFAKKHIQHYYECTADLLENPFIAFEEFGFPPNVDIENLPKNDFILELREEMKNHHLFFVKMNAVIIYVITQYILCYLAFEELFKKHGVSGNLKLNRITAGKEQLLMVTEIEFQTKQQMKDYVRIFNQNYIFSTLLEDKQKNYRVGLFMYGLSNIIESSHVKSPNISPEVQLERLKAHELDRIQNIIFDKDKIKRLFELLPKKKNLNGVKSEALSLRKS